MLLDKIHYTFFKIIVSMQKSSFPQKPSLNFFSEMKKVCFQKVVNHCTHSRYHFININHDRNNNSASIEMPPETNASPVPTITPIYTTTSPSISTILSEPATTSSGKIEPFALLHHRCHLLVHQKQLHHRC